MRKETELPCQNAPIFFDRKGWRKRAVDSVNWGLAGLFGVLLTSLAIALHVDPTLPQVKGLAGNAGILPALPVMALAGSEPEYGRANARAVQPAAAHAARRYGHFIVWDDNSFSSLKRHGYGLDVVIAEWLAIGGSEAGLRRVDPKKEEQVVSWVAESAPHVSIYPLLNNYDPVRRLWDRDLTRQLLESPIKQRNLARQVAQYLQANDFPGLVLDFEQLSPRYRNQYRTFANVLAQYLKRAGKRLIVQLTLHDYAYDVAGLAEIADQVNVMLYDEHTEAGKPGPLAGQGWFEEQVARAATVIPAAKLIVGIGSYAHNWPGQGDGQELSIQEAWELLSSSGSTYRFDPASLNPTFSYTSETGTDTHSVWMLDAVTAYNNMTAALSVKPAGISLWRLGTEDQAVWNVFARGHLPNAEARSKLEAMLPGYDVLYRGEGEVLEVRGALKAGQRRIAFDAGSQLILEQSIVEYPQSTVIHRLGARQDKKVALTFDDGPDPKYTDRILDILQAKNVKAAFFVVGSAAIVNQSTLQRIYREGHEIGNHTFTHANSEEISIEQLRIELNATQRLLESTIGVRTRLFRPPYAKALQPQTIDAAEILRFAGSLGYWTIGMNIDPKDWFTPLPRLIVERATAGVRRGEGNIVLLHDAGGTREATIAALPQIIDTLQAEGYDFVSLHELLGIDRDEIMPPVTLNSQLIAHVNSVGFSAISGFNWLAWSIFYVSVALGCLRLFWVLVLAAIHKRRERARADLAWRPASVTAIVPAYNESVVICNTIDSLLASTFPDLKVIVVDDGSTDDTLLKLKRRFGREPRLTVISKPNGGKWSALNTGLEAASDEIVVMLDADTVFAPDAIEKLVRHFGSGDVGAVCGHAVVGNRNNLLTRFQSLEYATNQNLDRRALEVVNGITVVPGAIGAWRRSALAEVGNYMGDTLAEDADATIRLNAAGWRILYEPLAVAKTEAPETIAQFLKQRLRWMFGTLQVAYKNLRRVKEARHFGLAVFGLPNILLFQFLFTLLAPIVDIMVAWSLLSAAVITPLEGETSGNFGLQTVVLYWALFQIVEVATALFAISLDRRDGIRRLVPLLFLQKFIYRQLLYVTAIRVIFAALKGNLQSWGKLHRTGNVAAASDPVPVRKAA